MLPPAGAAPATLGSGELAHLNATAVEQASARFQHAIDQLQKRIFELEHPTQPVAPETAKAIAPAMESIIRIAGTKDAPARDITLRGLTLSVDIGGQQVGAVHGHPGRWGLGHR
jgi:hypothetical protein